MEIVRMRRLAAPALLATGLSLAAASPPNRGSMNVHQPVVTRTDYVLDVRTDDAGRFAPGEVPRVAGWFAAINLGYGDRIALDGAAGRDDLAAIASGYGLLLDPAAPVTAGAIAPGTSRVVVSRARATVTGCPDWSRAASPDFLATTTSDYGCATAVDLAAMVADPQDLVRGQAGAGGGADALTVGKAIKMYRDQVPTGTTLKNESTGGK